MNVLIIEQEKTLQKSLGYFMERFENWGVFLASSEKEATGIYNSVACDIVVCGDRLPDGDGLNALQKFMKLNPNLISILMTAHGDESLRDEAIHAGISCYLEKPFDLKELEEAIRMGQGISLTKKKQ